MSDTLPDVVLTTTPQTLSALTAGAIVVGTATRIQNLGASVAYYNIGASLPDKTAKRRIPTDGYGSVVEFAAGEDEIWLWASIGTTVINAEVAA